MSDMDLPLAGVRAAVAELVAASEGVGLVWTRPRAPGKWSPSQVVEHVARIMEESANVASNRPSKFPTIPFLLRPIVRVVVFKRTLWRNAFPKMKAIDAFVPVAGSASPADGRVRLEGALSRFDQACRARGERPGRREHHVRGGGSGRLREVSGVARPQSHSADAQCDAEFARLNERQLSSLARLS